MPALQIPFHPLGTEHAAVDGEFLPGLEADDLVLFDLELNAALDATKTAMRLHQPVRRLLVPSARGFVVQVRAVAIDEFFFV